jgi:hypothetical protein
VHREASGKAATPAPNLDFGMSRSRQFTKVISESPQKVQLIEIAPGVPSRIFAAVRQNEENLISFELSYGAHHNGNAKRCLSLPEGCLAANCFGQPPKIGIQQVPIVSITCELLTKIRREPRSVSRKFRVA